MIDAQFGLVVWTGLFGLIFEGLAVLAPSRYVRRVLYIGVIILTSFTSLAILVQQVSIVTVIVAIVAVFRVINAFRVIEGRMKEPRLRYASRRSSLYLLFAQILSILLWWFVWWADISNLAILLVLSIVSVLAALIMLIATRRNLLKSGIRASDKYTSDNDLPSVSICIPARNETRDLPACLSSIVKSDYLKLEILVLDDCSQDRTSEIIKGFAQDGVRFIPGKPPADGWLAKNQAYQALAEAASGEILIFCGVDTRLDKHAIRSLVGSMLARKKQMISILPKSVQASAANAGLLQPMRYWWELALPRRLFNRPPVLSTVWAISRQAFFSFGEMKSVKGSIMPEGYFARELTKRDEYSFMRSNGKLNISTEKRLPEQLQSAIRTRYPRLRNRPENVLAILLLELCLFALPISLFLYGFFVNLWYLWILTGINVIILVSIHYKIIKAWGVNNPSLALALFPAAVVSELAVTLMSMWKYEFSKVEWKDRNICIPVIRYHRKLPEIQE